MKTNHLKKMLMFTLFFTTIWQGISQSDELQKLVDNEKKTLENNCNT